MVSFLNHIFSILYERGLTCGAVYPLSHCLTQWCQLLSTRMFSPTGGISPFTYGIFVAEDWKTLRTQRWFWRTDEQTDGLTDNGFRGVYLQTRQRPVSSPARVSPCVCATHRGLRWSSQDMGPRLVVWQWWHSADYWLLSHQLGQEQQLTKDNYYLL